MNDSITTFGSVDAARAADDTERCARLARLDHDVRRLEHERLEARSTPARLVALDVELCRMEATRRALAPGGAHEPDP